MEVRQWKGLIDFLAFKMEDPQVLYIPVTQICFRTPRKIQGSTKNANKMKQHVLNSANEPAKKCDLTFPCTALALCKDQMLCNVIISRIPAVLP